MRRLVFIGTARRDLAEIARFVTFRTGSRDLPPLFEHPES